MGIENCKHCNRVFRKQLSPLCPDCQATQTRDFDRIYQYLQHRPNQMVHIYDIAEGCGIHFRDVEKIFFSGRLGLAGQQILYNCQMCTVAITPTNKGRKRLCAQCSIKMEIEGKLHLTHDEDEEDIEAAKKPAFRSDEDYEAALAQKKADLQTKAQESAARGNYGFKRLTS